MTKVELLRWLYLRDNYLVRALLICLSFCLFFPSLCSLSPFKNIFSFGMAVEGTYTQDCARWQLKGHSWQDVKNGERFSTKNSALRLYSSTFIYINVFTDFRIHKTRKSQRMVDCCVFVTISYSVTLLPLQIHVMGKAEGSKTKVKRAISKWNKNEIFQNTLLAL